MGSASCSIKASLCSYDLIGRHEEKEEQERKEREKEEQFIEQISAEKHQANPSAQSKTAAGRSTRKKWGEEKCERMEKDGKGIKGKPLHTTFYGTMLNEH